MATVGKRLKKAYSNFDKTKLHELTEAVTIVKSNATAKFDETIEIALKLGIDVKKADQQIRSTVVLPNGTGKTVRVAVIAKGDKVKEAEAAGADAAGSEDLIEKIAGGWMEFDILIATPDIMAQLAKLGRVLGPKGLMPNPKVGTVTAEVGRAVKDFKAGKVEIRAEKNGIVHVPVGKASFDQDKLEGNILAVVDTILKLKPATAKGTYMKSVALSSTMGVGVKLDTNAIINKKR